jgi:hypothetical protein
MITREHVIAAASSAGIQLIWDGKFGREDYQSIMGSFPALERFYIIAAASRDPEVAKLNGKLMLAKGFESNLLEERNQLREQVTLLRDVLSDFDKAAINSKSIIGFAGQSFKLITKMRKALAATEPNATS